MLLVVLVLIVWVSSPGLTDRTAAVGVGGRMPALPRRRTPSGGKAASPPAIATPAVGSAVAPEDTAVRAEAAASRASAGCSCGLCRRELLGGGLLLGMAAMPAKDVRQRFFVAQMQGMADYEKKIAARKAALFQSRLGGLLSASSPSSAGSPRVVEIGVGVGTNFKALRSAGVRSLTAIEPNQDFVPLAEEAARKAGMELEVRSGVAERLPFEDNSVDAVVATLVMCSVASVAASLKEVRRVLRPGGRYVFTEHVGAPAGHWLRVAQDVMNPLQQWFSEGCNLNREPLEDIQAEFGAANVHAERFVFGGPDGERSLPRFGDGLPPHFLLAPHVVGHAEKRA